MNPFASTGRSLFGVFLALGATVAGAQQMVTARVMSSAPVWEAVPVQSCSSGGYTATSGVGALVGGLIGGVVGNSFGGGDGRALATAAGVLGGAVLGNTAEAQQRQAGGCGTHYENRVVGYDVSYEWGGQVYQSRMPADPGGWVQVPDPSGYGGAAYGENGAYNTPVGVPAYPVATQVGGAYSSPPPYSPYYGAGRLPPGSVVTAPPYPAAYPPPYPVAAPRVVYVPAPPQPVYVPQPVYMPSPLYVNPVGVTLSVGGVIGGHHRRSSRVGWGVGLGF